VRAYAVQSRRTARAAVPDVRECAGYVWCERRMPRATMCGAHGAYGREMVHSAETAGRRHRILRMRVEREKRRRAPLSSSAHSLSHFAFTETLLAPRFLLHNAVHASTEQELAEEPDGLAPLVAPFAALLRAPTC
jgi:hypothetical protein